jgi:hypothetical protein
VTLVACEKLAMGEAKGGRNVKREWLAPLTGVVFVALGVLGFLIGGEPPGADEPVQEIVDHYTDNEDSVIAGAILVAFAAVFLIFFAGYLRKVLRAAEGEGGVLSAVSLVGAVVMAVGIAIDATISFALAEAVEDVEPAAVQALQALWDSDFIPIAVGTVVFLLSTGISIVRHAALPKWLGWVAILLAVVGLTPIGFVAFLGGGIWILIISVMLALRARPVTA